MPSKSKKKHSKASLLSLPASSSSSPSLLTPNPVAELSEEELLDSLEEASKKYPSLIGKSAFIGRVSEDVVDAVGSKGCKIWLSESAMVASSIAPGSTVSVSLASMKKFSSSYPLSSLADECARHFGFSSGNIMVDEVGSYFALATVFPSSKVLKNVVQLSSNLSCTMACPASGRIVFVYPIHGRSLVGHRSDELPTIDVNCFSLCTCKELHLALVSSKSGILMNSKFQCQLDIPTAAGNDRVENESISSPKTPFSDSKLSFRSTSQLTSPRHELESASCNKDEPSFNSFDIREVLGDVSAKKLLQTCCNSWLHSRSLFCGNLVMIPIFSKFCIFKVTGANKMSASNAIHNLISESYHSLSPQTRDTEHYINNAFSVDFDTKINLYLLSNSESETQQKHLPLPKFESEDTQADASDGVLKLGGLEKEYSVLKDVIISSAVRNTLSSLGLRPMKGVLLHGPPGTGKTSLAQLCAHDAGVNLFSVNGPEIVSQYYGESERALQEVFDSASRATPAVVFIDELDAIAPARRDGGEELSQRMVATLLNLMDGISRIDGLLVIAATNRPDSIEPALRRPGRLDREIEVGVPSSKQRYDILHTLLSEMDHCLEGVEIQHLALVTHGFVGADLAALCNEAALDCLRRYVDSKISNDECECNKSSIIRNCCSSGTTDFNCLEHEKYLDLMANSKSMSSAVSKIPVSVEISGEVAVSNCNSCIMEGQTLRVSLEDFEKARAKVRPSAMREVILEVPKVRWEDVGGQMEVKMQLMEAVEWPQKHQDAFKRIGTRPPTGVLMFGPPGCSKTMLARAVASEAGLNFLAVKGPELFSKWVGESEKAVRSLFAKARANAPSIIFFDEIDSLAVIRGKESDGVSVADRVMSQLLVELDGLHQRVNVTVIAATNRPDKIDPALLRPGRFDRLLYVGPPSETEREDIFRVHLCKMPCSADVRIKELALLTKGYTGADIYLVCREAAVAAIEESFDALEVTMEHLKTAIQQVQPTEIRSYQELSTKFQRLVLSTATKDNIESQPCPVRNLLKPVPLFFYWLSLVLRWSKSTRGS